MDHNFLHVTFNLPYFSQHSHQSLLRLCGDSKHVHSEAMKEPTWVLGGESIIELYEYKNLGAVKNHFGSFSTNADDSIDKTRKNPVCHFPRTLTSGR